MYKVFISNKPLYFVSPAELPSVPAGLPPVSKSHCNHPAAWMDSHHADPNWNGGFVLMSSDESEWLAFQDNLQVIPAAGGAVKRNGRLLFIYRRGHWDLPKGKIESGESIEAGAVREVEEECGLEGVEIIAPLMTTWHTFLKRDSWCLKPSHWFEMRYDGPDTFTPQVEEDIEAVRWMTQVEFASAQPTFPSIIDVAERAF